LSAAAARGALEPAPSAEAALDGAEVVVLAGPLDAVVATLRDLDTDALVTDVAGVKQPVVEAGSHLPHFVGGHPMAGRERGGAGASSAALFRGAAWVLTTDGVSDDDLGRVDTLVRDLQARPVRMTAADHDLAVAVVSHLPQVLAASLLELAEDHTGALDLAAGSFRDLTRVASSDPAMWSPVLAANRDAIGTAVAELAGRLGAWPEDSVSDRARARLEHAAEVRAGLAPPVVAVRVALVDRPGELARVGRALAGTGVDVRDLQLRHGPHGGGGLLTISVRPGEAAPLAAALEGEGLELVP
ncbi:MAG TPA: prephenate dehydrogenase/arogenate dehydrogenase family protein, partial [Acidimicrobiia bacterium]|nr:prephenate dehydrogenase/arogenate dehydrogenase family protein [Acidimicrobiia bacterium]